MSRPTLRLFVSVLVLAIILYAAYRYNYPYGSRPACLPVMLGSLNSYANANGGAFPNTGATPLEALRVLHPDYLYNPEPLAGLSGNKNLLRKQISAGSPLTEEASSWVYWPGLRADDNPDIAVIWERKSGLRFNGSRAHGREVGFVGGYMRQIPDASWDVFVRDQERLRKEAISARNSKTNGDAPTKTTNAP